MTNRLIDFCDKNGGFVGPRGNLGALTSGGGKKGPTVKGDGEKGAVGGTAVDEFQNVKGNPERFIFDISL